MIPASSAYNIQGMPTLNFNNLIANTNQTQTALPISALGNILQLHCNPSLTLQVNGASPIIPISSKDSSNQEQINTFRSIFPNQSPYQNIPQSDQCTNTSSRSVNHIIQDLLSTYQSQQDSLSQVTMKYNFLLNAMERLLFDVQNNIEYSLLALGISQTIAKVKLNQLNGVIPIISQSYQFPNCSATISHVTEPIPIQAGIDLTNQRTRSDSMTATNYDKKSVTSHSDSNFSGGTSNSNTVKMTSLDKLDKLIDETVKKTTGKKTVPEDEISQYIVKAETVPGTKDMAPNSNTIDVNVNMGNAIHQIIRQFYQNTSMSNVGNNFTETSYSNVQQSMKTSSNSFVTEITTNTQIPFNSLGNQPNQSFILCNNLVNNSVMKTQPRDPFILSMGNSCKENNAPINVEATHDGHIPREDIESMSNHDDEEMCFSELDPTEVATKVRDILSLHSIGQRLFAKHVLNLSQGTVSELLSKPKPWSKLSEKGRDSYRKMSQWALDSSKVQELKSIAPRKGFSGHYAGMSPATPIKDDQETQEKIKRILNDAKMAMASTNSQPNVDEDLYQCYAKVSDHAPDHKTNECPKVSNVLCNPLQQAPNIVELDITQLQKKFAAALQSIVVSNNSSRIDPMSQMAPVATYQQSPLIVMNLANVVPCQSSLVLTSAVQTTSSSGFSISTVNPAIDNRETIDHENDLTNTVGHKPSNGESLNIDTGMVSLTNREHASDIKTEEYDCTKMYSNILGETKSSTDLENLEKFLKSFMGSIKQTEKCVQNEEINTPELINVIKDHLTKNSISQRTFGCLLGLSQGTVSDILSRPKPWSVLTNKGREPYIRMLKYLIKPAYFKAIETSVQHTHVPNKVNDVVDSVPNSASSSSSSGIPATLNLIRYHDDDEGNMTSSTDGRGYPSGDDDHCGSSIVNLDQLQMENLKYDDAKERIFNVATRMVHIDTATLTTTVNEMLKGHNIGPGLFGECILNVNQKTAYDILSTPQDWNLLSVKGKEPYVRMQLWLQEPDKMRILLDAIEKKKDDNHFQEIGTKENSIATMHGSFKCKSKVTPKRTRVIFTDIQRSELTRVYVQYPHPKIEHLNDLSKRLNLPITTVNNWFHNQRIRNRGRVNTCQVHNTITTKIESISGESEINSEKSIPTKIDESFNASDSDNSNSAPHLYPEYMGPDNIYRDKMDDDDYENDSYFSGSQLLTCVAGSNKRKRTNPIKLEIIANKSLNKDSDDSNEMNGNGKKNVLVDIKVSKRDQSHV